MTTSALTSLKLEISREEPISDAWLAYFAGLAQANAHQLVLNTFLSEGEKGSVTRASIAKKLNKKPEQITRWLGGPGNWTLETLSELLLAMGYVPVISTKTLDELGGANYFHEASKASDYTSSVPLEDAPKRRSNIRLVQLPESIEHATSHKY